MAKGDQLDSGEEVIRAGMFPYWDQNVGRGTPSAFVSEEVSISRLSVLGLVEIVSIFKADFKDRTDGDGNPSGVQGLGRARVEAIVSAAEQPLHSPEGSLPVVALTVEEDPIQNDPDGATDNPAHALIRGWDRTSPTKPKKITRAVAKRLVDLFVWESLS